MGTGGKGGREKLFAGFVQNPLKMAEKGFKTSKKFLTHIFKKPF